MAERNGHITLYLFRCGRSQWASDGRLRGITDLPLSAEGRTAMLQEIDQVVDANASVVLHPADEAAAETAAALAERVGGKPRVIEELQDPDLGLLEGISSEQFAERYKSRFKRWQSDPLSLTPPEGEGFVEARDRIFETVAKSLRKSKNGAVAMVLHDVALGLLGCWLQDRPTSELWATLADRPVIEQFDLTQDQIDQLEESGSAMPQEAAAD